MGEIIAVVSGKGGTGKTSFVAGVGFALAHTGWRVLCLDFDITLRNLDLALGLSDRALMDFSDVLAGRCTLSDAAVPHGKYPTLHLLTAPVIREGEAHFSPQALRSLFAQIRREYDYCLVDAPAGLGQGFSLAVENADRAVVVTTPDPSALRDAQRTVMELSAFPGGKIHLVVGRVQRRMLRSLHTTIDDAIDTAGLPLLGVIPEDSDVPTAAGRGIPLREVNYYAARAYENIAKRLTGHRVPLMKL